MALLQRQTQQLEQWQFQRLEILQMSALELNNYIQKLFQENPVVDLNEEAPFEPEQESLWLQRLRWLADSDQQNYYYQAAGEYDADPIVRIGISGGLEETLPKFICRQVDQLNLDFCTAKAVRFLAFCLDGDGYLRIPLKELASETGISEARLQAGLNILYTLEPAGIGAVDLSQCLMLQLERAGMEGPILAIVQNYLEPLSRHQYHMIAKRLHITENDVLSAQKIIRELNPKPGSAFEQPGQTPFIYPDVFVEEMEGELVVRLRGHDCPPFQINQYYRQMMKQSQQGEVRDYLRKQIQTAQNVLQAISQREDTLRKCVQAIVNWQERFFRLGEGALRPLRMADIAEIVGLHESTVSRAVREKYLQCRRGIYPISFFFSSGTSGAEMSGIAIKSMLQNIIKGEDKSHPLSDQKLCEELERRGCSISRRTVAKYRDEMNIPGASGRKARC